MKASSGRSAFELVAAARRDLEHAEAALARRGDGDCDRLLAAVALARAARTADAATFALLDSHALERRLASQERASSVAHTPKGYSEDRHRS
jgi:hypothetical protein